jgi:hypothetical protein
VYSKVELLVYLTFMGFIPMLPGGFAFFWAWRRAVRNGRTLSYSLGDLITLTALTSILLWPAYMFLNGLWGPTFHPIFCLGFVIPVVLSGIAARFWVEGQGVHLIRSGIGVFCGAVAWFFMMVVGIVVRILILGL